MTGQPCSPLLDESTQCGVFVNQCLNLLRDDRRLVDCHVMLADLEDNIRVLERIRQQPAFQSYVHEIDGYLLVLEVVKQYALLLASWDMLCPE